MGAVKRIEESMKRMCVYVLAVGIELCCLTLKVLQTFSSLGPKYGAEKQFSFHFYSQHERTFNLANSTLT